MEKSTSTFTVEELDSSILPGDVVGLVDSYGTTIYLGVITEIDEDNKEITAGQIESLFDDEWLYRSPDKRLLERAIEDILVKDFKNSKDPIVAAKFNFDIEIGSETEGYLPEMEMTTTMNFEDFIYSLYNTYGIRLYFNIPFTKSKPKIIIQKKTYPTAKIANNTHVIQNLNVEKSQTDINKIVIYSEDGYYYRGEFFTGQNGYTADPSDPNRLPVVNTQYIFSDDDLTQIIVENLEAELYSHYITFEILFNHDLYKWEMMYLGQPMDIWYNGEYYKSIYTGFQLNKSSNADIQSVQIKCGKVRSYLTSKILSMVLNSKDEKTRARAIPLDFVTGLFERQGGR